MQATNTRKITNLNVRCIEDEIYLIQESERDYSQNGGMDAREVYIKGLEFINNLK